MRASFGDRYARVWLVDDNDVHKAFNEASSQDASLRHIFLCRPYAADARMDDELRRK